MSTQFVAVLAGIGIAVGLLGIVVPVLPGLLLCWLSGAGFALYLAMASPAHAVLGWTVLGCVTAAYAVGLVAQHLLPARALKAGGVPWTTVAVGVAAAVVGFFVVPVVGAVVGFVAGILVVELARLRSWSAAWPSTVHALKAVGTSMLIELATGLVILGVWVVGMWLALR